MQFHEIPRQMNPTRPPAGAALDGFERASQLPADPGA